MSMNAGTARAAPEGMVCYQFRLQGAGAAAPTLVYGPGGTGKGATVTRAGVGDYSLTLPEKPGLYAGAEAFHTTTATLTATTKKDVQVEDDLISGGNVIHLFSATPATDAAAAAAYELTTADFVLIRVYFRQATF